MKFEKTSFSILLGPGLLLIALILLFYKASNFVGPVWMAGLSFAILIACAISYLAFQEFRVFEKSYQDDQKHKEKQLEDLRNILDETHRIYREKVTKLEEGISASENEQKKNVKENENALLELKQGYEELFEQSTFHKNQVTSLQSSLQDALDELRNLRQKEYLREETEKEIPKDLMQQHKQLRTQFEEKALMLEKTRKDLFILEGEFIALRKEIKCSEEQENFSEYIVKLLEEKKRLEEEKSMVEQIVNELGKPTTRKTTQTKKSKQKIEKMLELQFEKPST